MRAVHSDWHWSPVQADELQNKRGRAGHNVLHSVLCIIEGDVIGLEVIEV